MDSRSRYNFLNQKYGKQYNILFVCSLGSKFRWNVSTSSLEIPLPNYWNQNNRDKLFSSMRFDKSIASTTYSYFGIQIGITSFGNCETEQCKEYMSGEEFPSWFWRRNSVFFFKEQRVPVEKFTLISDVFTDIRKYCNWIKESTEGKVTCQDEEVVLEDVGISV